jgi:Phage minor structural protein GP20
MADNEPDTAPAAVEKSYPESVVQRMIEDRAARVAKKYADYDDLKTEVERLREQVADGDNARKRAERAEAERDAIRDAANTDRLTRALVLEAVRAGARNPELVARLIPDGAVTLDEAGEAKGADKAVATLAQSDAYLFSAPAPPTGDGGVRQSTPARNANDDMNTILRRAVGA